MIGHKFVTTQAPNRASLEIVGYSEPNNGRELWQADLLINSEPHNQLFKSGWKAGREPSELGRSHTLERSQTLSGTDSAVSGVLNFNLNSYQFCSSDESLIFVPAEAESFVVDLSKSADSPSVAYFPYVGLSTVTFLGNCFHGNQLAVVYRDSLHIYSGGQIRTESLGEFSVFHFCCQDGRLNLSLRNQSGSHSFAKIIDL